MSVQEPRTCRRIHVGNVSPALKEKGDVLSTRMAKFGKIVNPLEFHTKATNDYYFGYVDMELNDKDFERLKAALNGILYMGRKISIAPAKAAFDQAWKKDHGRPSPAASGLRNKAGIALARDARIREASSSGPCNSITGAPLVKSSLVGASNSSLGYMKSAHTFSDMSGNTKNKSPSHSLVGQRSYGSTLVPKGSFSQQYSRLSGHGDVVKGRVRKTERPPAYFMRKQQTMRVLINGELKQIKCYKTKLWGVDQKSARDLTYRYVDGTWRSGDDHIVERSTGARKHEIQGADAHEKCGISGDQAQTYGASTSGTQKEAAEEASEPMSEERAKNTAVLAKLFNTFDFEKQADIEIDDASDQENVTYDSKGRKTVQRFDFETQGAVPANDSDSDDDDGVEMAIVEEFKTSTERPPEEVYFSESDEGNDIDMDELQKSYTTEAIKNQYDEEHEESEGEMNEGRPQTNEESEKESPNTESINDFSTAASESDSNKDTGRAESSLGQETGSASVSSSDSSKDTSQFSSKTDAPIVASDSSDPSETSSPSSSSESSSSESSSSESSSSESSSSDSSSDSSSESSSDSSSSEDEEDQAADEVESSVDANDNISQESENEEEDLMPKFGAPATQNTTESLRSLFNQNDDSAGFSLAAPEDDIDEEKEAEEEAERQTLLEQIKEKQEEEKRKLQKRFTRKQKFGLFWSHFESPFLQTQTQLSKIGTVGQKVKLPGEPDEESHAPEAKDGEEDDYEKWFWSMRGEISRECKKRRREATKHMRKKSKAYL